MNLETRIIYEELRRPLKNIQWRIGKTSKDKTKAMALGYIDAREARARLNEVVGFNNWQTKIRVEFNKTICDLSIRLDGEWITKSEGAGDTDFEADKGAISDAFKRACIAWGIGEYLYNLSRENTWVEIDDYKKIKKDEYEKLNKVHNKIAGLESHHNEDTFLQLQDNWVAKIESCSNKEELDKVWEEVLENVKPYYTKHRASKYMIILIETKNKKEF